MSGLQRTLSAAEAELTRHKCICGAELKVKPVSMPDDTSRAVVPEHDTGVAPAPAKRASKAKVKEEPKEYVEYTAKDALAEAGGYSIYVDCVNARISLQPFSDYVGALAADVAANFNLPDVRLAPSDSALGFGRWKGALAAAARDNPPVGAYYARSGDELGDAVWQALELGAKEFVRGVR